MVTKITKTLLVEINLFAQESNWQESWSEEGAAVFAPGHEIATALLEVC